MTYTYLDQNIFRRKNFPSSISVNVVDKDGDDDSWIEAIREVLDGTNGDFDNPSPIGLSILSSTPACNVDYIALSNQDRVVVIKAPWDSFAEMGRDEDWEALASTLVGTSELGNPYLIVAFELDVIALSLYRSNLHVSGIDLSVLSKYPALPSTIIGEVMDKEVSGRMYVRLWNRLPLLERGASADEERRTMEIERVAWRAWMTAVTANARRDDLREVEIRVTSEPDDDLPAKASPLYLDTLANNVQLPYNMLDAARSDKTTTEFESISLNEDGDIIIHQAAYKSKIRQNHAQEIRLYGETDQEVLAGGFIGRPKETRQVTLKTITRASEFEGERVRKIEVEGREDLGSAEVARSKLFLALLRRTFTLDTSPLIRKLWFPTEEDIVELEEGTKSEVVDKRMTEGDPLYGTELMPSQLRVARAMLSEYTFSLVHGPPGTGKTRTISEVVKAWIKEDKMSYLVAQTNVGVRNIAEALINQEVKNFKLLVSGDFEGWHEAIYVKLKPYMISSKQFRDVFKEGQKALSGVKVILSTINMLYNPLLEMNKVFETIPLERLIIDEASQIFVGDYLPLFFKFRDTLKKVCWFGDPWQLPPHQREQIEGLKSIYDVPHMRDAALLLDTQRRMPNEIAAFISTAMYKEKLKSIHPVKGYDCLRFVDVTGGAEEARETSWVNLGEVATIVDLILHYYMPAGLEYTIITPYDSQRKEIQKALDTAGIPAKDKCFNVDSFQGNEAPYILISCVRTSKTGFLDLHNRVNVMLTRCQQGMVIITNKFFVQTLGQMTLVGQLASWWERKMFRYIVNVAERKKAESEGRIRRGKGKRKKVVFAVVQEEDKEEEDVKEEAGVEEEVEEKPEEEEKQKVPDDSAWVSYLDVRRKIVDLPGVKGVPPVEEPKVAKPKEAPALNGFFSIPTAPKKASRVNTNDSFTFQSPQRSSAKQGGSKQSSWGKPEVPTTTPSPNSRSSWAKGPPSSSSSSKQPTPKPQSSLNLGSSFGGWPIEGKKSGRW
ncbi:hypothetical protein FRB99_003000 [Tulasnella sp. 403]|nr:hypothetical protein FRB99_003000 [Tulasnella sp. 403]